MSTPSVSPTHHVHHWNTYAGQGTTSLTNSVVTPQVALIRQLRGPPNPKKATISLPRSSGLGKPTRCRTSRAPTSACVAAPRPILAGIASELSSAPALVASGVGQKLTRNDPSQMPGHTRGPPTRTPAKARPAGGQIAVA
jgi:hypothetical protein